MIGRSFSPPSPPRNYGLETGGGGSAPLVPPGITVLELENVLVLKLNDHVKKWKFFVNDTFVYIKRGSIEYAISVLNSFHDNLKFTSEQKNYNRLPFLNILFF